MLGSTGAICISAGVLAIATATPAVPASVGVVPSSTVAAQAAPGTNTAPSTKTGTSRPASPKPKPRPVAVPPTAVRLDGGQTARVRPAKTNRAGQLEPPDHVTEIGWWTGGAALGSTRGTMVLVGHVDAVSQGKGFFARLRTAQPGQQVKVFGADGRPVSYRVTGLRTYSRNQPLPSDVFASDVAARLTLITCTGHFNAATGHYSTTLVVYAIPEP